MCRAIINGKTLYNNVYNVGRVFRINIPKRFEYLEPPFNGKDYFEYIELHFNGKDYCIDGVPEDIACLIFKKRDVFFMS